jgi:alpha-tubulin suppressor-like RCC1 family protein
VVDESRKLVCWGSNAAGQLGADDIGAGGVSEVPVSVSSGITWIETGNFGTDLIDVVDVSLGAEHSCAVLGTGHLACWGQQADGRLGNGDDASGVFGQPLIGVDESRMAVTNAEQVSVGRVHGCIVTKAKSVACWGDNSSGQLGQSPQALTHSSVVVPVPGLGNVTDVAAGAVHTCAISAGQVYCWGNNEHLQLGTRAGSPANHVPTAIAGLSNVVAVVAGRAHTCAIDAMGSASCWGSNGHGELQRGDFADSASPVRVAEGVTAIAPGDGFTCVLTATGAACWGDNLFGQLGRGHTDFEPQSAPENVSSLVTH